MSVQVMLLADVKDLGVEGDVVSVSEGYARNMLFPRNVAALMTPQTKRKLEKIRRERDAARKLEVEAAKALVERMAGCSCTIAVKVSESDKLFGSVTDADIAASLKAQGFEVDASRIVLEKPFKELGVFDVTVRLHPEVSATVKVWIVEE